MSNVFEYLIEKIESAEIIESPFPFVLVTDFLKKEHFQEIMNLPAINVTSNNIDELLENLTKIGYKHQQHPGTFKNINSYKKFRKGNKVTAQQVQGTRGVNVIEGGGFTVRLSSEPPIIRDLTDIFRTPEMENVIRSKFNLLPEEVSIDCGLQKYLHGYEISPHPDTREKALTWMLNMNPDPKSHDKDYHTHFCKFTESYQYVQSLWESIPDLQRHWVPWDWAETCYLQKENNSIAIFSPSNASLHAVRAYYDDLQYQRTQIYGNYWYKTAKASLNNVNHNDIDIKSIITSNQRFYESIASNQRFYESAPGKILRTLKQKFNIFRDNIR
jgi:hypothetical protein